MPKCALIGPMTIETTDRSIQATLLKTNKMKTVDHDAMGVKVDRVMEIVPSRELYGAPGLAFSGRP